MNLARILANRITSTYIYDLTEPDLDPNLDEMKLYLVNVNQHIIYLTNKYNKILAEYYQNEVRLNVNVLSPKLRLIVEPNLNFSLIYRDYLNETERNNLHKLDLNTELKDNMNEFIVYEFNFNGNIIYWYDFSYEYSFVSTDKLNNYERFYLNVYENPEDLERLFSSILPGVSYKDKLITLYYIHSIIGSIFEGLIFNIIEDLEMYDLDLYNLPLKYQKLGSSELEYLFNRINEVKEKSILIESKIVEKLLKNSPPYILEVIIINDNIKRVIKDYTSLMSDLEVISYDSSKCHNGSTESVDISISYKLSGDLIKSDIDLYIDLNDDEVITREINLVNGQRNIFFELVTTQEILINLINISLIEYESELLGSLGFSDCSDLDLFDSINTATIE